MYFKEAFLCHQRKLQTPGVPPPKLCILELKQVLSITLKPYFQMDFSGVLQSNKPKLHDDREAKSKNGLKQGFAHVPRSSPGREGRGLFPACQGTFFKFRRAVPFAAMEGGEGEEGMGEGVSLPVSFNLSKDFENYEYVANCYWLENKSNKQKLCFPALPFY